MKGGALYLFFLCLLFPSQLTAQELSTLRLNEVLHVYVLQSPVAQIEQKEHQNDLLQYENYRKGLLPSVSFSFNPVAFNRSLRLLQSPEDGSYSSVEDYANSSSAGITISQRIGFTGGSLQIGTNLSYLNEFSDKRHSFTTSPFFVSYSQQLWGGRKLFLFDKKIQEAEHSISIKKYCSKISKIQEEALELFFIALSHQLESELTLLNSAANDTLLSIAKTKLTHGHITEYDYRQVELQTIELQLNYRLARKQYEESFRALCTYLGLERNNGRLILPDFDLPSLIERQEVEYYVKQNNPTLTEQEVNRLEAEKDFFNAKMETRFNGNLSLNYGINQYAENFTDAYRHANKLQTVTLSFQIPIWQWGINRNKRKIARNTYQARNLEIENIIRKFRDEIEECTDNYNHSVGLWQLSERAYQLSREQYQLAIKSFALGHVSVYELTDALQKQHETMLQFYSAMRDTYAAYYRLRGMALYDFKEKKNLEEIYL